MLTMFCPISCFWDLNIIFIGFIQIIKRTIDGMVEWDSYDTIIVFFMYFSWKTTNSAAVQSHQLGHVHVESASSIISNIDQ